MMKRKKLLFCGIVLLLLSPLWILSQDYIRALKIGASGAEFVEDVETDGSGNLYLTGTFQNTVDFDPSGNEALLTANSSYDIYIAKYNPEGEYRWAVNMGGNSFKYYYSKGIGVDAEGNSYISGFMDGWLDLDPSAGEAIVNPDEKKAAYLAKYNPDGDYLWGFDLASSDGEQQIVGWAVRVEKSGNSVYLGGYFSDTVDFDPSGEISHLVSQGNRDMFVARYTDEGQLEWVIDLGYPGPDLNYGSLNLLTCDDSGNIYIGGYFSGTIDMDPSEGSYLISGPGNGFIAKYNSSGALQWAFPIPAEEGSSVRGLRVFGQQVYALGDFYGTADFDPSGNTFELTSNAGESSGFIAVYDLDMGFLRAGGLTGIEEGTGTVTHDIVRDSNGNLYVIGSFYGTMDVDPSEGVVPLGSTGGLSDYDMFLIKYDGSLNYTWGINAGGNEQEQGQHVQLKGNDQVIAFGYFDGWCDFDPSEGEHSLSCSGSHDLFMAWYTTFPGSSVPEAAEGIDLTIMPNPAGETCKVHLDLEENVMIGIGIMDLTGRIILQPEPAYYSRGTHSIPVSTAALRPGVYFLWIEAGNHRISRKMIRAR